MLETVSAICGRMKEPQAYLFNSVSEVPLGSDNLERIEKLSGQWIAQRAAFSGIRETRVGATVCT
jgi:hypothetical protein